MSDLIERLKRLKFTRERGDGPNGVCWDEPCDVEDYGAEASLVNPDGAEAADRIAALEAEVERLRKAGDGLAEALRDAVGEIETGAPLTALDVLTEALTHWQEVSGEYMEGRT